MSEQHVVGYDDVPDAIFFDGVPDDQAEGPPPGRPDAWATPEVSIPVSFSDAHAAEALADFLRGRWLYVAAWNRWLWWDGARWAPDTTDQVREQTRQWSIELVTAVARTGAGGDDVKRAARYRDRQHMDAALALARNVEGIASAPEEFDQSPDLLNVANGVVNLRTGELLDHDPRRRMTKLAPVAYRPDAYHQDTGELLRVVDLTVEPWLRRLFGYAATGHTSEDVVPVLDGTGANGKSTLLEAVGGVLGDYASAVAPGLIMRTGHEPHPTIKADLMGKRLTWISETEEGGAFRMEQVKALTGGDQISARYMRGDFFTFAPTHTLLIATNHRPAVNSTEHAAWRRLRLVPFPFTYRPADELEPGDRVQDRGLRARLSGDAQRQALLAWIVRGAGEWYRDGLGTCPAVTEATRTWRMAEDVVLRFITDELEFGTGHIAKGRELYAAYTEWCQTEGRHPKSNKNFATEFLDHEAVKAANVEQTRPKNVVHYRGVGIRANASF